MKTTRKLLLALVLVMSILMTLAVAVIPASAENSGYYLKGTFNGWGTSNQMQTTSTTNVISVTIPLSANTTYQFKINNGGNTWYGKNSTTIKNTSTHTLSTDGADVNITTTLCGNYTFTFNKSSKEVTVTYPEVKTLYFTCPS